QLHDPLVEIGSAGLLQRPNDRGRGDRTEQLAGVRRRLDGDLELAEILDRGLQLVGVLTVTDGLELAGAPDLGGLPLGPAGGEDGQAARQQIVTAVAVLDLDGVTGRTEMVHLGGQNEFHLSRLSYSVSVARPSAPTR